MEQDATAVLWSSYRTIGAGWPDFYALLREPPHAGAEVLRLAINTIYAHAGANRDHRDLRRRFYYQMLQEKVLPEARRILLDAQVRRQYDEQWRLHAEGAEEAISYERFLSALPGASAASSQLDAQIAQELTARLEVQLAAQRVRPEPHSHDDSPHMTEAEMGALPVSSPLSSPQPGDNGEQATPSLDARDVTTKRAPLQVLTEADGQRSLNVRGAVPSLVESSAGSARIQGEDEMEAARPASASDSAPDSSPSTPGTAASERAASERAALRNQAARAPRIVVGLSNEEMRAIGRRSQQRSRLRSLARLGLGAAGIALAAAGTTWALLGRPRAAERQAEIRLQAAVERSITNAIERSQQPRSQPTTQAASPASGAPPVLGAARVAAGAARVDRVDRVAANVPRMRLDTLLQNADFEGMPGCSDGDLQPWKVWSGARNSGLGAAFAVGAGKEQDARSGRWRLVFWKDKPYEASVSQLVRNLRPGIYQLNAWTKRSGGQEWGGIVIADYGGPRIHYLVPASTRWTPISVRGIRVTNGQCKIGFYTRSPRGRKWLAVDAIEFHRQT